MSCHRTPALAFPPSRWARSSPRGTTGTHWMLKGRRTMARLSHSPSTANLLAQYTALKGSPGAEPHAEHHNSSPRLPVPQGAGGPTLHPPNAAGDNDPPGPAALHGRQECLDGADSPEEVHIEESFHGLVRAGLQRSHQSHPCIADCQARCC